jgi:hypothetical protein
MQSISYLLFKLSVFPYLIISYPLPFTLFPLPHYLSPLIPYFFILSSCIYFRSSSFLPYLAIHHIISSFSLFHYRFTIFTHPPLPNLIIPSSPPLTLLILSPLLHLLLPGVQPERLADAFNVKHCALSLVGEPIMYPRINELLKALHDRKISTFLVTNAQVRHKSPSFLPILLSLLLFPIFSITSLKSSLLRIK